jgi:hypothetical protein
MKFDVAKFIDGLHGWLGDQFAPIVDRLKRLEAVRPVDEVELTANVSKALDPKFVELYERVGTIQTSVKEISLTPGPKGEDGLPGVGADEAGITERLRAELKALTDAEFERLVGVVKELAVPGKDGEAGKDGEPGAPGKDADEAAFMEFAAAEIGVQVRASVEAAAHELKALAVPGPAGESGPAGAPGKDAEIPETLIRELIDARVKEIPPAADGKSVPIEDVQRMVDDAVQKRMAEVRVPADGNDGRDALHLEILAGIDLSKNYPRNTYAKHLGGLWRSFEKTHELRGWECIVNGVAGVEYEPSDEDPRVLAAKTILSDGTESCAVIRVPAMVYKGVFREGEEYEQGDTVTWAGSLWHCQEPTREKPAESGVKSWRLAVKKGRDAPQNAPTPIDPSKSVRL